MFAPFVFSSFAGQYGFLPGQKPANFVPVKKWYCKEGRKSSKTATLDTNTSIARIFAAYESRRMCANKQIGLGVARFLRRDTPKAACMSKSPDWLRNSMFLAEFQ